MNPNLGIKRLGIEFKQFQKEPVPHVLASPMPENVHEWRFVIRGNEDPYTGGYYHGKLVFPKEYPLLPPSIMFITPSGRFQTNTRLCLSISDFHPESWSPTWNVGSILTGVVSFMNSEEITHGGLKEPAETRRKFAGESIAFNLEDSTYVKLFGRDVVSAFADADRKIAEAHTKIKAELSQKDSATKAAALTGTVFSSTLSAKSLISTASSDNNSNSNSNSGGGGGGSIAEDESVKKSKPKKKKKKKKAVAVVASGSAEKETNDGDDDDGDDGGEDEEEVADARFSFLGKTGGGA